MEFFIQTLIGGLTAGSVYAAVALGVVMIYSVSRVLNLAQGEFCILGALLTYTFWGIWGIPFYFSMPAAILIVAGIGILIERFIIRQIKQATVSTLFIVTVAIAITIRGGVMVLWGKNPIAFPSFGMETIRIKNVAVMPEMMFLFFMIIFVSLFLWIFFERTPLGKAIVACAENPNAASLSGINVRNMHLLSYALSASIGALAGILFAPITFLAFNGGALIGLKGFMAAMVGGVSQIFASILAGLGLGILEAMSASYISSQFKDAIAFLLLLIFLIIKSRRADE